MSTYLSGAVLAVRLTQGFSLTGTPEVVGETLKISDSDGNPSFTINFELKTVDFFYTKNIRDILVAGVEKVIEQAGYTCIQHVMESKDPMEQLIEQIKGKISDDIEILTPKDIKDLKH